MRTLLEALYQRKDNTTPGLIKQLKGFGMTEWEDITRINLNDFKTYLNDTAHLAPKTIRAYLSVLSSTLNTYGDEADIPCTDFRKVCKVREEQSTKTYLKMNELAQLERVELKNDRERFCLYRFLVGAYTGMRYSDICETTSENIHDDTIIYTSIKTGITASTPCKPKVREYIEWLENHREQTITLAGYEKIIRRLCKKAGITKRTKIRHAGKDLTGEKWEFVSSHTARVSFVTNLVNLGVPIITVSAMCGHTNCGMTERYIAERRIELDDKAMIYFK